ncbi:hypothetical protein B566_EDAN005490, partial [Ephemera danica]
MFENCSYKRRRKMYLRIKLKHGHRFSIMLQRRTLCFIFVLLGIALEVSASVREINWNPQTWIDTDKEDDNSDEDNDLDLCHGYVGSQEQICYMILNLTRISRSSLGPKLQEAVDNEHLWCATTIEAHNTILNAELLVIKESLDVQKQTVLFLAGRETELEQELEEARKKSDALQFHFKRVTKENEALSSQMRELKSITDQRNGDKEEVCKAQQTRISSLEQQLQQSLGELLDTQTGCNATVVKLEQKAETRLREIQNLKKKINEGSDQSNTADAENKATILLLQQREQQYNTNIANLDSQVKDLQRELEEAKKTRDQCQNEGEILKTGKKNVETNLQRCTSTNNKLEEEEKKLAATLKTKTDELEACIVSSITTTTIRTTRKTTSGTVKLATGTYLFQGMVGGKYLSWEAARQHCQTLGMDLVAIESPEENAALAAYGRSLPLFRSWMAWTSGCYSKEQKNFVWQSTSSPLIYKNLINPRSIETNAP